MAFTLCVIVGGAGGFYERSTSTATSVYQLPRPPSRLSPSSPLHRHQISGLLNKLLVQLNHISSSVKKMKLRRFWKKFKVFLCNYARVKRHLVKSDHKLFEHWIFVNISVAVNISKIAGSNGDENKRLGSRKPGEGGYEGFLALPRMPRNWFKGEGRRQENKFFELINNIRRNFNSLRIFF